MQLDELVEHDNFVYSIDISPEGRFLASGSNDKTIKIWNLGSGTLLKTFKVHDECVFSVAFSATGKMLASGNEAKTIAIFK